MITSKEIDRIILFSSREQMKKGRREIGIIYDFNGFHAEKIDHGYWFCEVCKQEITSKDLLNHGKIFH